jgi:hypothetical protein
MTSPKAKLHLKKAQAHPEHAPKAAVERHARLKAEHVKRVSAAGERSATPPGKASRLLRRAKPEKAAG